MAHLNHQLRGADADADEAFVRNLAAELNLPFRAKAVNINALAEASTLSLEMAARQARHQFFEAFKGAVIALAHHSDDQAETFILKLARGAGTEGLGGMAFTQQVGALRLIRPLLNTPRAELIQWLTDNGFSWREDQSNRDESILRNKVRHTILPLLERELNPNIRAGILRTMNILREENEWMEKSTPNLNVPISNLPRALQRRVLRKWLFAQGAENADFETVEEILALMNKENGSRIYTLNERQRVVLEYGVPRFESTDASNPLLAWTLTTEAGIGWKRDSAMRIGGLPAEASFNAEKVGNSPIEVRPFKAGDRMQPLGMEGSRKLQDIFTDLKVPRAQRAQIPIVVCRGEIIWIPGYRIDAKWALRNRTDRSIHVRMESRKAE